MRAIVLAAVLSIAAFGQSTKQPIQATTIAGISSSWAGEGTGCPGTINNLKVRMIAKRRTGITLNGNRLTAFYRLTDTN